MATAVVTRPAGRESKYPKESNVDLGVQAYRRMLVEIDTLTGLCKDLRKDGGAEIHGALCAVREHARLVAEYADALLTGDGEG